MFADPTFDSIPAFFLAILPEMSEYLQVGETVEIASSPRAGKKPYDPVNLPKESANETLPSVSAERSHHIFIVVNFTLVHFSLMFRF